MGEGELTFNDLMDALNKGKTDFSDIPGLSSRKNGSVVFGPVRPLIKDLDTLPIPAYDLFPMDKYVGHTYWKPFVEIVTSRGVRMDVLFVMNGASTIPDHLAILIVGAQNQLQGLLMKWNYWKRNLALR